MYSWTISCILSVISKLSGFSTLWLQYCNHQCIGSRGKWNTNEAVSVGKENLNTTKKTGFVFKHKRKCLSGNLTIIGPETNLLHTLRDWSVKISDNLCSSTYSALNYLHSSTVFFISPFLTFEKLRRGSHSKASLVWSVRLDYLVCRTIFLTFLLNFHAWQGPAGNGWPKSWKVYFYSICGGF